MLSFKEFYRDIGGLKANDEVNCQTPPLTIFGESEEEGEK